MKLTQRPTMMIYIDISQNLEQNRNKYLSLYLAFAALWQDIPRLSPKGRRDRRYFLFHCLIKKVRRLLRRFACGSYCVFMQPDIDKYMPMLEEFDLTHEQKIELIHTLWGIMTGFKDKAFGLDPAQHIIALRDQKNHENGNSPIRSDKVEENEKVKPNKNTEA